MPPVPPTWAYKLCALVVEPSSYRVIATLRRSLAADYLYSIFFKPLPYDLSVCVLVY